MTIGSTGAAVAPRLTRRAACALALAGLAATPVRAGGAQAGGVQPAGVPDWFRHGPELAPQWQAAGVPGDPLRAVVRPGEARPSSAARRRILALYPRASSAYDTAITKFLHVFADKQIDAELTAVNFRNEDARGRAALEMAGRDGFDLILSMGSESTAWLWDAYRGGAVPVVSVCSKDPVALGQAASYERGSGVNFAFTSLNMPTEVQMAYVLELRPGLKNLAILVDANNVSAVQTQAQPLAEYARARGVRVLELAVRDPERAAPELDRLVGDAVAAMRRNDPGLQNSLFLVTGSTTVFREIATINARADRVPVLSVVPEVVRAGDDSAVLSIGISFESNAHLAAVYAADILEGRAQAGALRVGVVSPPDIAINFRKARDIGLRIPFSFFESASTIYDYEGQPARSYGETVAAGR